MNPSKFHGKPDKHVDDWIYEVGQKFRALRIDESRKVALACTLLEDKATRWWKDIPVKEQDAMSWKEFREKDPGNREYRENAEHAREALATL